MSKEIRSLIESIKKDQTPPPPVAVEPILPPSVKTPVLEEKPTEKIEIVEKSVVEKVETPKKEAAEAVLATNKAADRVGEEVKKEAKPRAPKAKAVAEPSDFDTFFANINEADFQLEQKTVANIDNRFYEIFMSLKRKKKVKNVSLIVNAILKEYIERHKENIVKTLSEGSLV